MGIAITLKAGAVALKRMRVPLFLSKYSKKDFTVHQHLLLCAVRELEKKTWRGLRDRIEDSKAVDEYLGLKRTPHFTTPQKFLQRIPRHWFSMLMQRLVSLLTSTLFLAADATGFRLRSASSHYLRRLGQDVEVKDFLKSVDLVDVPTGLIVATRSLPGHRHEAPHLIPMLQTLRMPVKEVYGDKAFDSERIHRFLWESGAAGYIDVRGEPRRRYSFRRRVWGYKQAHPRIWKRKYGKRPFVESTYHAEKAVVGEVLPGRTWEMQDRYHLLKTLSYDLLVYARRERGEGLIYLRGFLQTRGWRAVPSLPAFPQAFRFTDLSVPAVAGLSAPAPSSSFASAPPRARSRRR
jgi:hypothetical protein